LIIGLSGSVAILTSRITLGEDVNFIDNQSVSGEEFDSDIDAANFTKDMFTKYLVGSRLDISTLPDTTLLCTAESFDNVAVQF